MSTEIRRTSSLCPVCLRKLPASLERIDDSVVLMKKTCPRHGTFRIPVWKDRIALESWIAGETPLTETETENCSGDCRTCSGIGGVHGQDTCCVILEVTKSCNLHCSYCFAHGGESDDMPSYEDLCAAINVIAEKGGGPLIQLSGGEPTLRDDLPALLAYAKKAGCRYTQINTNGIRLAEDEEYVRALALAGLDIVFLQYDGTDDAVYRKLRGRNLLEIKQQAIKNCGKYRVGVTLVPTIVRGINDQELGNIIRDAVRFFPVVRSVHFQPVTYLGRYPDRPVNDYSTDLCTTDRFKTDSHTSDALMTDRCTIDGLITDRYTLDELMADLCRQTGIPENSLLPSRCDHAMCEFHSTFLVNSRRQLLPMSDRAHDTRRERTPAARNRQYVAEHWRGNLSGSKLTDRKEIPDADPAFTGHEPNIPLISTEKEDMDFDEFVRMMRTQTMKISAMAFQDAMNIDLERLYRCSLHVYENGRLLPFCSKYLTPVRG